jgi:hypothetical protein
MTPSLVKFLVLLLEAFDAFCIVVKAFLPCFQIVKFPSFNILFHSGKALRDSAIFLKGQSGQIIMDSKRLSLDMPPWYGNLQSAICFKCLFFSGILTGVQSYKTLRAKITPVQKFLGMFFVPIKPNSK